MTDENEKPGIDEMEIKSSANGTDSHDRTGNTSPASALAAKTEKSKEEEKRERLRLPKLKEEDKERLRLQREEEKRKKDEERERLKKEKDEEIERLKQENTEQVKKYQLDFEHLSILPIFEPRSRLSNECRFAAESGLLVTSVVFQCNVAEGC